MPLDKSQRQEIQQILESKKTLLSETVEKAATPIKAKKAGKKTAKKSKKKGAAAKTKSSGARKKKNPIQAAIEKDIKEIELALKRLEEQEERFGYCEHCFLEIPWRELAANPARRRCSRCT